MADPPSLPAYAELHCLTNFSFQRGASHPGELVREAYALGYAGLAITDECSVAGVVRAWEALRDLRAELAAEQGIGAEQLERCDRFRLLYGSEFAFERFRLVAIARNLQGWGNLCEFISTARMDSPKGSYRVDWQDSDFSLLAECEILLAPRRDADGAPDSGHLEHDLRAAAHRFGDRLWLAVELWQGLGDELWLLQLQQLGAAAGVPLVAAGDVQMHKRSRKRLHDVLAAVREGKPVEECGFALQPNAERRLRKRMTLSAVYPADCLARTLDVLARCPFRLDELRYRYPDDAVPYGMTPTEALRHFTYGGARQRYPGGIPAAIERYLQKELALIEECRYEMFFLTVYDVVRFARERKILCQGRGSAANSVVCWCLGITAADPEDSHPLLERFISLDRRHEPPDIDVDFEHERREEVIQYLYRTYGRDRAAIAAVVISYRTRSAIRDVGKALAIPDALVDAFARDHHWFDERLAGERMGRMAEQTGSTIAPQRLLLWLEITQQLLGFPRHLSQHVGGFVLTEGKLTRVVPVENAAMKDRSVIQWDKDDLEALGLMKVDVLALGMLTAIRRCLDLRRAVRGEDLPLHRIPRADASTYDMICRADTVGVFQIESRAQMSMLPRLKPRVFYDLVVEVAIVRPGPIVGKMVHPYLKNREKAARGEAIVYQKPELQEPLGRTLGVPIFQEQVMQLAVVAAGFTPTEADRLRRSMAAWKRHGSVHRFYQPLIDGMVRNDYPRAYAESIFQQILGFGEYGFPESHAYSFALLAYASSWLKCHEPAAFLAALLNAQPMGFYHPSQLVQDARRHGIEVRPPDVAHSDRDCTLEGPLPVPLPAQPPVRLGLRLVAGLGEAAALRVMAARAEAPFASVEDLALRARLDAGEMKALAAADALRSLAGHRRQQVWEAAAQRQAPALLRGAPVHEAPLQLPAASEGEEIVFDYASLGLTLRRHPLALLRRRLARRQLLTAAELQALPHGSQVSACGMVTVRQQPQTANGTIFVTLEDETGPVNVIVWKQVRLAQRSALLQSRLLAVHGHWQRDQGSQVCHLVAQRLEDLTPLLGRLGQQTSHSRDFH